MNKYYEVSVRMLVSGDKGDKYISQSYLVYAMSTVDVAEKINKDFEEYGSDFEIKSIKETKIQKVIE